MTNIFEKKVGALNIAPTKISGQYKIVIDMDNKLWLDDYNGRRKAIDITVNFLQQVSNFLSVDTNLVSTDILRYGATQSNNIKKYHIPLYFVNNIIPKYFVVSKVENKNFSDYTDIYTNSDIVRLVDIQNSGLQTIVDQINQETYFDYPLYFNWEDNNVKIFGQGIKEGYPITKTIDLTYLSANQPYIDVVNNTILNTFKDSGMFFPRFLNIEIEFEYIDNITHFNNFIGFLSMDNLTSVFDVDPLKTNIIIKNILDYRQIKDYSNIILENYLTLDTDFSVTKFDVKPPQYRLQAKYFSVGNKIKIYDKANKLVFEYTVKQSDIKTTLFETAYNICKNASTDEYSFDFDYVDANTTNIIIRTIYTNDGFVVETNKNMLPLDNTNMFYSFGENDLAVLSNNEIGDLLKISVTTDTNKNIYDDLIQYDVIDSFYFDGYKVFRLNENIFFDGIKIVFGFITKQEQIISLEPINFYSYYSNLNSEKPYDFDKYKQNLIDSFGSTGNENFQIALNNFNQIKDVLYKYVEIENNELVDKPNIDIEYVNENEIKNILFSSNGFCSYITPNIFNIDMQFWENNGCPNIDTLDNNLKFNWFLLKGVVPQYLVGTINENRYLDENNQPRITSLITKNKDNKCETIFLGVKYFLPLIYENYNFCVYLDFDDKQHSNINYSVEIDDTNNLVKIILKKYLDFNDLIRGGETTNTPIVDLSLFFNSVTSMNNSSESSEIFLTTGIDISPFYDITENLPFYNNIPQKDWIVDNNFCVRKAINSEENFLNLFPVSGDYSVDIYSTLIHEGVEYSYKLLTVTFENINNLYYNYFWCSDIKCKFFDEDYIFLYDKTTTKTIKVLKTDIINSEDERLDTLWGYYHKKLKIKNIIGNNDRTKSPFNKSFNKSFGRSKFVQSNYISIFFDEFSLKENYFNIKQTITENFDGSKQYKKEVFKFTENIFNFDDTQFIDTFFKGNVINNIPDENFDKSVDYQNVTLFDKSQIWSIVGASLFTETKFKYISKDQLKIFFDEFSLLNFKTYCDNNSLLVKNDLYLKLEIPDIDNNVVIYNLVDDTPKITLINRHRISYSPYFENTDLLNFQINNFKKYNSLFNLYDENFGGINISGTGLWSEVNNVISTIFCKENIILLESIPSQYIDFKKLLENTIDYEDCIITNTNSEYVSKIDANEKTYIISEYAKMLLLNYYKLYEVRNQNGQKINYSVDDNYTLNIPNYNNYTKILITLTRK